MRLTSKEIRQITKEELDKVLLRENSYEANLSKWQQKSSMEPEAWEQESDQYFDMLQMSKYEEFMFIINDDLAMLAYILNQHEKLGREETLFLGSLGRSAEAGEAGNVVIDYIKPDLETVMNKFANIYNTDKNKYSRTALRRVEDIIADFDKNRILSGYLGIEGSYYRRQTRAAANDIELFIDDEFTDPKESIQMLRNIWHVDENGSYMNPQRSKYAFLAKTDLLLSKVNYPAHKDQHSKTSEVDNNLLKLGVMQTLPEDLE
tara:strand:- start:10818 stop:11603 length:786 start_codon:yes stop_codon:yes gene_type:complete